MMDQREKYAPRGLLSEFVGGEQRDPAVAKRVLNGDVQLDIYGKTCDRVSQLLFNTMSHHHFLDETKLTVGAPRRNGRLCAPDRVGT